ncbi:unnamed protein product, partial [Diamesa tonsa]
MQYFAVVMILANINYGQHTKTAKLDFEHYQSDGEYPVPKQYYHSGESQIDFENDIVDEELVRNPLDRGPYFELSATKNITALAGNSAYLNCRVRNLGNRTVSWIRHRDLHLLTVGKETYTPDQRFQSVHNPHTDDWSLKVLYPQQRDSGVYECQISTTPPVGYSVMFSVVEPDTTILGGDNLYIDTGSTINLTCVVKDLPEPPPAIYWTHNGNEINYDSPRGGVSVITEKSDITTSYLLIQRAKVADSGKYTCSPSHANPISINVHVLNAEHPAAIQQADRIQIRLYLLLLIILFSM